MIQDVVQNLYELSGKATELGLAEMMHILNVLALDHARRHVSGNFADAFVAAEITCPHFSRDKESLVYATWHPIRRQTAEHLLRSRPPGTFLFRKDLYTLMLEEQLNKRHEDAIRCWTLTYTADWEHVIDAVVVHRGEYFLIYNDSPQLQGVKYHSIDALLNSFGDLVSFPLDL